MNFKLSDEQKMIQQVARDFAREQLAPIASELDQKGEFPQKHLKKMAELGFMGMMIPQEWGGSGLDTLSYVVALEEIAAGCASTAVTMSVNNSLYCGPIFKFGNENQKNKYLTRFARGEKLGAYCLSEPGTGSDAANQQTTAALKGDVYLLNGTKNFITNGPNADAMVVFAMTDKVRRHKGISAFIVDKNFSGFSVGKIEKKLGIRASSTCSIVLQNCEVPRENLLGKEGEGFSIAMSTLDGGRIGIATQALGISRAALEAALKYSREREAFGKVISDFQAIQWMLADSATRIEASRLLIYKAASLRDEGKSCTLEAAQAKLYASETSNFVTNKAVQIHGGYGYCCEYPVERYLRDARITEIYEGTSEIQRLVIARSLLKNA